jgi:uncharacterized spore protein YtfJ
MGDTIMDRVKREFRLGGGITIGPVTIIPIERRDLFAHEIKGGMGGGGVMEPVAVIVIDPTGVVNLFAMDGEPVHWMEIDAMDPALSSDINQRIATVASDNKQKVF